MSLWLCTQISNRFVSEKVQMREGLHSGVNNLDYEVPYNKKKTHGDRGFSVCGPKLWNGLPLDIRQCVTYESFKCKLKTQMFRKYYSYF